MNTEYHFKYNKTQKKWNNNVILSNHPYENTYILIFNTSAEYFMTKMNFNWKIITDAVGKVEILHSGDKKTNYGVTFCYV